MTHEQNIASDFAVFIKGLGFTVYMAESGTHGFITDANETRVLSFGASMGAGLSGNYGPPSKESGTGWVISKDLSALKTADDVHRALYINPPSFCGHGWKRLTTVAEYLEQYQQSSKFRKL